jgi:hypothetical protein
LLLVSEADAFYTLREQKVELPSLRTEGERGEVAEQPEPYLLKQFELAATLESAAARIDW